MRWEESLDKLEKIITKNINICKNHEQPSVLPQPEKKEISGPLLKVELPILDKAGRISAREISKKFKVPVFSNLKRLTPIPSQNFNFDAKPSPNPKEAPIVQVFAEESINTLEEESQNHTFLFDIDAFVDSEFLSKSRNVIFYHDLRILQDLNGQFGSQGLDGMRGNVEQIFYKDSNVLIRRGSLTFVKGISFVKLESENDQAYNLRLSLAVKLRNEFEYNSVLHHIVKCMMMDLRDKMPRLSNDLIKKIQSKSKIILNDLIQDDILNDLEERYFYSQTKAWIISNNIFERCI